MLNFLDLSFLICKVKVLLPLGGALIETLHTEVPWCYPQRGTNGIWSHCLSPVTERFCIMSKTHHPPQPLRNDSFSWMSWINGGSIAALKYWNAEAGWWPHLSLPTCKFPLCVTHAFTTLRSFTECITTYAEALLCARPWTRWCRHEWKAKVLP